MSDQTKVIDVGQTLVGAGDPGQTTVGSEQDLLKRITICCKQCGQTDQIRTSDAGYIVMIRCDRCFGPGAVMGTGSTPEKALLDWMAKNGPPG